MDPSLLPPQMVKNPSVEWETWLGTLVGRISWRRERQSIPVFLPGDFHGQRSLAGYRMTNSFLGRNSPYGHHQRKLDCFTNYSQRHIPFLQNNIYLCVITLVRLFNKYLSLSGDQISSHKSMFLPTLEFSAASRLPDPKYMPKQSVN